MEEHDIVLVDSGYTLLLYMLLTKELHKNKTYIFSDKTLLNYFEKSNFKLDTVYIDKDEYNKILSIKLRILKGIKKILFRKKLRKILLSEIEKRTKNKKIQYIGNDHILTARVIWDKIDEFTMIEDGIASYYYQKLYRKSRRNKFKSKKNLKLGLSPKIKKVIFSGIKEIPKELIKKAEILDLKKVYEEKDDVDKKEILDFFTLNTEDIEKIKTKRVIFLTQPFSQDGILTLEEEISIYEEIFKNYKREEIMIKTHPRDRKDYSKYFPDILVFDKIVPFELFDFVGVQFDVLATVASTASLTVKNVKKVDFYGSQINKKLEKKLGKL